MTISSVVWPITIALSGLILGVSRDEPDLTMEQKEFLHQFKGEWELEKVLVQGRDFHGRVGISGVDVSEDGLTFLVNYEGAENFIARFARIDPDAERMELTRSKDGKTERYALRIDDEKMWLVLGFPDHHEMPESLRPTVDNICIILTRKKHRKTRNDD